MAFTKDQIQTHRENFGDRKPAVNVKCYHFATEPDAEGRSGAERLSAETGLAPSRCEVLLERAYESAQHDFWEFYAPTAASECLGKAFNLPAPFVQREFAVYSEGRSGGWLTVQYKPYVTGRYTSVDTLPDLESWDAIKVSAWGRFAKQIRGEIDYLRSYMVVKDNLAAMGDLDPDAERNEIRARAEAIAEPYGFSVVDTERSA